MLEGIAEVLGSALRDDPRLVLLYADALPGELEGIRDLAGEREINVGIAEATLVSLASGLGLTGMRPVVVGIASFLAGRAYSQLRQDVALNSLPVTFIGFAAGGTLAEMGPTHCTLDDLGLMGLLPGMDLASANDPRSAAHLLREMLGSERCGYLRVEGSGQSLDVPIEGGVERLRDGADATIVVHGAVTHAALEAADLARQDDITVSVLSVLRLRPLELTPLREAFRAGPVMVIEEHVRPGGLGSMLLDVLSEPRGGFAHLTPNAYLGASTYAPEAFRVDAEQIRKSLLNLIANANPVRT